jgi:hypothetical protein
VQFTRSLAAVWTNSLWEDPQTEIFAQRILSDIGQAKQNVCMARLAQLAPTSQVMAAKEMKVSTHPLCAFIAR